MACRHRSESGRGRKALRHRLWVQFFGTLVLALLLFAVLSGLVWRLGAQLDADERFAQQPAWQLAVVERLMMQMGAEPGLLQENLRVLADGTVARISVFSLNGQLLASVGEPLAWVARDSLDVTQACQGATAERKPNPTPTQRSWPVAVDDAGDGSKVIARGGARGGEHGTTPLVAGCEALRGHTWQRSRSGLITVLHLADGRTVVAQWPWQGFGAWWRAAWVPWTLPVLLALAVALASWPIARRLTRRLEALQREVDALGRGDLAARVDVRGKDEVADLARSFNRSAERIENLVKAHRHLLAHASHELRSPLARLKLAVDIVTRDAGPVSDLHLAEVHRNVQELDVLIDEILTASRLEAVDALPKQQLEQVDLLGLVVEEAAHFGLGDDLGDELDAERHESREAGEPLMAASEAPLERLDVDACGPQSAVRPALRLHVLPAGLTPPMIEADPTLMRRLIRNLLENARKHGKAPTEVVVQTSAPLDAGKPARLTLLAVGDHGPGISLADQPRLFEPFFRAHGHAEADGGTGLGLALVRQIARLHGAEAAYQSEALSELVLALGHAAGSGDEPAKGGKSVDDLSAHVGHAVHEASGSVRAGGDKDPGSEGQASGGIGCGGEGCGEARRSEGCVEGHAAGQGHTERHAKRHAVSADFGKTFGLTQVTSLRGAADLPGHAVPSLCDQTNQPDAAAASSWFVIRWT